MRWNIKGLPNPTRVRIALAEKEALENVEFIHIDIFKGEHKSDEFLAKNPSGAVPLLALDDMTYISECSAITEYVDHHFDGISLTGTTAKTRAVINMMQRRAEANVLDAISSYFHHTTEGLMETYQNKDWGLKQKQRAIEAITDFDRLLSTNNYVAGQDYSIADITLYAALSYADFVKIEIPKQCQHLSAWRARMASRPAVVAAC